MQFQTFGCFGWDFFGMGFGFGGFFCEEESLDEL